MIHADKCRVRGCKRDAETRLEPGMGKYGMTVPVCWHHFRKNLWWYKCWIFCRDEEAE